MARTIQEIQDEIILAVQNEPSLSGITSASAVAIWKLWTRIVAASLETEEQLNDLFRLELEQIARDSVPGTAEWLQKRVLEFQYDALSPQVVQVIDGRVGYPVINESLRIIARAAVKEQSNGRVLVKAAKEVANVLTPLDASEKTSLEGYLSRIGFVGIPIDVTSQQPDRLRVENLTVYYFREYNPTTVKTDVIAAIEAYLESISSENFNGVVVRSAIVDAIQAVTGVALVGDAIADFYIRDFSTIAPSGLLLTNQREIAAGYVISEDTVTYTLNDTITMVADNLIPNN
jgi:hypothetical protein